MKHTLKTFTLFLCRAVIATVMVAGGVSCSSDSSSLFVEPSETDGSFSLVMYVTTDDIQLAGAHSSSRAADTDGLYQPGTGYENYIDLLGNDYRILLFDASNNFVMQPSKINLVPLEGNISQPFSKTYRLEINLNGDEYEQYAAAFSASDLKVVMAANWRAYPESFTDIDGLAAAVESTLDYMPVTPSLDYDTRIPMWGVLSHSYACPEGVNRVDVGTLHLLRALAKVEISRAPHAPEIKSVTLRNYNIRVMCAPEGVYAPSDYIHHSWSLDYTKTPSIPVASEKHDKPLKLQVAENGNYIVYMPEYRNIGRAVSQCTRLEVEFEGFADKSMLEFKDYSSGNAMNVMRNTWYKFVVSLGAVSLNVQPYASVSVSPEFGLWRDAAGDLMVLPDEAGNYPEEFCEIYATHIASLSDIKMEEGDYYAIIRSQSDLRSEDTLRIKDVDGCRVLSNFARLREECNDSELFEERLVRYVVPRLGIDRTFYKDREGDELLQHNNNHSIVVRGRDGKIYMKTSDRSHRYLVESFDESTGIFWVVGSLEYHEYDNTGNATGKRIPIS